MWSETVEGVPFLIFTPDSGYVYSGVSGQFVK